MLLKKTKNINDKTFEMQKKRDKLQCYFAFTTGLTYLKNLVSSK